MLIKDNNEGRINESHARTIKIKADELEDNTHLTSREDEYKQFTKIVYELQSIEPYYISSGDHLYPRIIIVKEVDPLMVKMATDFGYTDLIYPDITLKEIEKFDDIFKSQVSQFAQNKSIYMKFYSISPEVEDEIYYPTEHIITIGHVGRNFQIDIRDGGKPVPTFSNV